MRAGKGARRSGNGGGGAGGARGFSTPSRSPGHICQTEKRRVAPAGRRGHAVVMQTPFVFGYGSLVNRRTHPHGEAQPARVRGWRRAWRHTALRPVAFLTAVPAEGVEIEGLVAGVPGADWQALDLREAAYDRVVAADVAHALGGRPTVSLYTIPEGRHGAPDGAHPVLLSYLDVVVQGYLAEFGEEGVARLFATTDGWDAPVADDRADPIYPRHQVLTRAERALVDRWLDDFGVVRHAAGDLRARVEAARRGPPAAPPVAVAAVARPAD